MHESGGNRGIEQYEKEQKITIVKEALATIRTEVLRSIFEKILRRSHVAFDTSVFVPPQAVEVVCMENERAGNYYDGVITLNAKYLTFDDEGLSRAQILKTYIHELTHALSSRVDDSSVQQNGYQMGSGDEKTGTALNEAMTEIIQDQVFCEYMKESGDRGILASEDGRVRKRLSYKMERKELVTLIELAAEHFGMSQQDIFRALTAGYFLNASGDMMSFFDELLPEGKTRKEFFEALRNSDELAAAAQSLSCEL